MNIIKEDYRKILSFYKKKKVFAIILSITILVCLVFAWQELLVLFIIGYLARLLIKSNTNKNYNKKDICPHCKEEINITSTRCSHCHGKIYRWTTWKKITAILGSILVLFLIISNTSKNNNTIDNGSEYIQNSVVSTPIDPNILEKNKKELTELKTKFDYSYDEFEKVGWYEAKTQSATNTWNKNMLKVIVNNSGYAYLSDQYYGSNWIFHTHVEVKIGESIYKSEDVPTYDPKNETNNSGDSVWETVSYTGNKDNGIIKVIAENDNATIKIRFVGSQNVKDFTLSTRDQQAIKDAYRLSNLLKSISAN